MVSGPEPVCFNCEHFIKELGSFKCRAFPENIPDDIAFGSNDHTKPYQGDGGLRFTPKEDV